MVSLPSGHLEAQLAALRGQEVKQSRVEPGAAPLSAVAWGWQQLPAPWTYKHQHSEHVFLSTGAHLQYNRSEVLSAQFAAFSSLIHTPLSNQSYLS